MRIAFYAPLKPIDHPVPSGDRRVARAFFSLIEGLGHEAEVASRLRAFEGHGDLGRQLAIEAEAAREAERLIARRPKPDLWFTYHAYHKAPDRLGPQVSQALGIPYVVAEASIAGKQAGGAWDRGHRATIEAVNAADAVLAMTRVDARNLERHLDDRTKLVLFPPFLPAREAAPQASRARLAAGPGLPADAVWLVTVAMMRPDIKRESYRLLAESLALLGRDDWRLLVVGDGVAGGEVRELLRAACGEKACFLGELAPEAVAPVLAAGDLFVWPALEEAYGMAILEALAAGLPVLACDEGGVADLVEHGLNGLLARCRSAAQLAAHIAALLEAPEARRRMGEAAARRVAERHSHAAALARLRALLARLAPCG